MPPRRPFRCDPCFHALKKRCTECLFTPLSGEQFMELAGYLGGIDVLSFKASKVVDESKQEWFRCRLVESALQSHRLPETVRIGGCGSQIEKLERDIDALKARVAKLEADLAAAQSQARDGTANMDDLLGASEAQPRGNAVDEGNQGVTYLPRSSMG